MITSDEIRDLTIAQGSASHRPAYLSAASGLVCVHSWIYVVADDENHLGVFRSDNRTPGHLLRLADGDLPSDKKERKKQKPDFEVLLRLPAFGNYTHGALLAAGSGSRPNRMKGVIVPLNHVGSTQGSVREVDLSFILGPLEHHYPALNIEGAVTLGTELLLFQRGNKKNSVNAVIKFPLVPFLESLTVRRPAPLEPLSSRAFDLGRIHDVPLSFTDAAALPDGDIVFSAVAEDTNDTYNDGRCVGSALGLIGADGTCRWLRRLAQLTKIEGLDVRREGPDVKILMVTDADDVSVPAKLLASTTPYDL